jgi:hypothetical protein
MSYVTTYSPKPSSVVRIETLAREHGITYQPTQLDQWANKMNELSDSPGELDDTLKLIVALERNKVVPHSEAEKMLLQHIAET